MAENLGPALFDPPDSGGAPRVPADPRKLDDDQDLEGWAPLIDSSQEPV
jgi:hypothetical protein